MSVTLWWTRAGAREFWLGQQQRASHHLGWLVAVAGGLYQRAADNPTSLVHQPDPVSADEPPTACNRCSDFGRRRTATAAEALLAQLGEHLARYKISCHVEFVTALPLSVACKILRRELRKRQ